MSATAKIIEHLEPVLAASGDAIVAAYLFGSVARGTARATSDVDVAVLFSADPPGTLAGLHLDLEADLERAAGVPVQLVVLNRAPADLVHRVLRDGILILDRDPSRRIRFEVHARNLYFDLKPHLDRYRRTSPATRR
jgi:predicted nucleotidyltransferase